MRITRLRTLDWLWRTEVAHEAFERVFALHVLAVVVRRNRKDRGRVELVRVMLAPNFIRSVNAAAGSQSSAELERMMAYDSAWSGRSFEYEHVMETTDGAVVIHTPSAGPYGHLARDRTNREGSSDIVLSRLSL